MVRLYHRKCRTCKKHTFTLLGSLKHIYKQHGGKVIKDNDKNEPSTEWDLV